MPEDETPKKKPETLDLIDEKKKPSRRARQRVEASKVKTVDDHKAEALDLGVEDEEAAKKKARKTRKTEQSGKAQLPSISKKLDQQKDQEFVVPVTPVVEEAPDATEEDDDGATVVGNVISIKPPIIVNTLAEKMGLNWGFRSWRIWSRWRFL